MVGTGYTPDFHTVDEVERDDATTTGGSHPGEYELGRVEDCPGTDPCVRRGGMNIEVPEVPDAKRLGTRSY